VRYNATFSRCVKSGTSDPKVKGFASQPKGVNRIQRKGRGAHSPIPVRYSSVSRSLTSSSLSSFALFGRPFRRAARSSSSSASCRASQTSETSSCTSDSVKTHPRPRCSSGIAWKKNPKKSAVCEKRKKKKIVVSLRSGHFCFGGEGIGRERSDGDLPFAECSFARLEACSASLDLRSCLRSSCPALRDSGWNIFSFLAFFCGFFIGAMSPAGGCFLCSHPPAGVVAISTLKMTRPGPGRRAVFWILHTIQHSAGGRCIQHDNETILRHFI
jgi:hypothetical protein